MNDANGVSEYALVVSGLKSGYGKAIVLEDLELKVPSTGIIGVAGPNGAGKTTLLRAISGNLPRVSGDVTMFGKAVPANELRSTRMGIVHVPEGRQLFSELTVRDNLRVGAIARRIQDRDAALEAVCDLFPRISPMLNRKAGVLSGGQQQLVAVARGLVASPRLLLIDELSLGLSPVAATEITDATISACRDRGTTVVLVDQNVRLLAHHCDSLLHLHNGKLHPLDKKLVRQGEALF